MYRLLATIAFWEAKRNRTCDSHVGSQVLNNSVNSQDNVKLMHQRDVLSASSCALNTMQIHALCDALCADPFALKTM